ncbi:MAG: 2-hydroxychromene-2-carboxylate isomerase [Polyangiaceae bacterium]|nr:2-hydroxychromene-2-carboxylate isomerase [Polyangiaceae bacterium]MCW5788936.1 2-hydroxychromene-2-carboxylate isomerase [Polyangiaceae bacterium]
MATLEFYYDFVCPYAYLASTQVEALARRTGAQLVYRPLLLGGLFRHLAGEGYAPNQMNAARAKVGERDLERYAALYGVPLVRPAEHPRRTVLALRATLASGDVARASHALFKAYWGEGADVEQPQVVAGALSAAGLDGAGAVARSEQAEVKEALRAATAEAAEAGVFGVPSFRVETQNGSEVHWGQDRLHQVATALEPGLSWPPDFPRGRGEDAARELEIELWYDFSSPYAYLGWCQLERIERETGARVRPRPFLLGAVLQQLGYAGAPVLSFPPAKQRYVGTDLERAARALGVRYQFPSLFPLRAVTPLRLALASGEHLRPLSSALFEAYWADGQDISNEAVLREIAGRVGVPEAAFEATQSEAIKQALKANTDEALARGLCGAPSFTVGSELFWGQDRVDLLIDTVNRTAGA